MKEELTQFNQDDIINFTNVDTEDFVCGWGKNEDGSRKDHLIGAGVTLQLPRYKAYAFAKHLVDKVLMKQGKDYGPGINRDLLEDKIFGLVVATPETVTELTPNPLSNLPVEPTIEPEPLKEEPKVQEVSKGFKCEICGKEFEKKIGMLGHSRSHRK